MKKKPSILRQTVLLLQIQILTVVLVLALAAGITLYSARERIETTGKNLLEVYSSRMEDRLSKAWQSLSGVLYENYDLDLLASANEQERYYASTRIITSLENVMKTNDSAQMLVIADTVFDICLEANDGHLSLEEKKALRDYASLCARDKKNGKGWQFVRIGGRQYLHRLVQTNTRAALVFISASSLMVEIRKANMDSMEFLLTDTAGQIMASAGSGMSGLTVPDHMAEIEQDRFFLCSAALADKKAGLFCLQKKTALLRQMKDGGLLLVGAALLLLLFDYYIFRLLRRKLVLPMERTTGVMEEISAGNPDLRLPREEETIEFVTLADTFNHLMDELVSLRIEYYEKKIALQETEEKYIRLQIRPHFFLNAMTTIASLSAKGKTEEINTYIDALSLNIRYMFSSGLHTVPLREEIRHVENYFAMQELKYPDAVFYYVDMPEEAGDWPVPQMILHTLVENEYKYAISPEGILTILVRIAIEENVESGVPEKLLVIEMEDDGRGYPEDVIASLNAKSSVPSPDGSRVGLYSIRRLLELMYEREDLFSIGNVLPHGALSRIRIPEKPMYERKKDT